MSNLRVDRRSRHPEASLASGSIIVHCPHAHPYTSECSTAVHPGQDLHRRGGCVLFQPYHRVIGNVYAHFFTMRPYRDWTCIASGVVGSARSTGATIRVKGSSSDTAVRDHGFGGDGEA